jgi:oligoendopeptidase F
VLECFSAFDDDFYKMAKTMFDEDRIDAPVSHGKKGGAFCYGSTPELRPYIMLNFLGKQQDIFTIAHELGHAVHDFFSAKQTLLNYHPILPLAETASVFSEMLVTDLLLKRDTDPTTKKAILTDKLESIFATSHRQNMFSRFEITAHKTISKRLMSSDELCELYKSELNMMFGKSIRYTDEYSWEWSSIPHIYEVPFYVYAYNFGNLLVMALYQSYLEDGKLFIPKYKQFLSMGSSASPFDIAKLVGANINSIDFWEKSLLYIEKLIFDLEGLVKQNV